MKIPARPSMRPSIRSATSRGFTLLEVLVSIVVLSFGVLGVVGLQAAALQANKEARFQSTAVALGRELADMMRANKDLAITTGAGNPYLGTFTSIPTANPGCDPCVSTTEVAQANMHDWVARVGDVLPGYRITICFDATPYSPDDNLPQWTCSNDGGTAVLKIGWTRVSAASAPGANPENSRPAIVLPLIAGSAT